MSRIRGFATCDCGKNLRSVWSYSGTGGKHVRLDGYAACPDCGKIYKVEVKKEVI